MNGRAGYFTGLKNNFAPLIIIMGKGKLNLPVGFRLLAVKGVDKASGTWISQWTLLDFFIMLIISIAIYKLWGIVPGILALASLGLCYHDPEHLFMSGSASSLLMLF